MTNCSPTHPRLACNSIIERIYDLHKHRASQLIVIVVDPIRCVREFSKYRVK